MFSRRRVVVTGFGAVTPLGHSAHTSWKNLLQHKTGMITLSPNDVDNVPHHFFPKSTACAAPEMRRAILESLPARVVAPVPETDVDFDATNSEKFAATSRNNRHELFAQFAATEALCHSGLLLLRHNKTKEIIFDSQSSSSSSTTKSKFEMYQQLRQLIRENKNAASIEFNNEKFGKLYPCHRRGVNMGVGMNSIHDITEAAASIYQAQPKLNKIEPFFIPKILCNTSAGYVAQMFDLMGPSHCTSTACATGLHCIGDGFRWIQYGEADIVVCGAAEAAITPIGLAGFARMKALSAKFNDRPEGASRPFDEARGGFVMGEGAGVLVLEEREAALARGAAILCEVGGYGMAGDAFHVSSPHPEGLGARRAMRNAMDDFEKVSSSSFWSNNAKSTTTIHHLNAHATSTPLGDEIELAAATAELRGGETNVTNKMPPLIVSSVKGNIGHLLGASGSVEAIFSIQSLFDRIAPGTKNLENPAPFDQEKVLLKSENTKIISDGENESNHANGGMMINVMSTSFGFGGTNAAVIFTNGEMSS